MAHPFGTSPNFSSPEGEGFQPSPMGTLTGDLKNTDKVMNDTFWFGVYPGLDESQLGYVFKISKDFLSKF